MYKVRAYLLYYVLPVHILETRWTALTAELFTYNTHF